MFSNTHNTLLAATCLLSLSVTGLVLANDHHAAKDSLEEMVIVGEQRSQLAGSAYALDEEALKAFNYTDINRVVSQIPGLYVRDEDGYGLRPNIGIRGATADRSQKLTLMEDGILIKPAPYSAPTAYYVPNVKRMQTVEVAKGPATIQYGPHTIGGAMNLVTPSAPQQETVLIELTGGSFGFQSYRAKYGDRYNTGAGDIAFWVEGLRYESEGFKDLDGGGDTGFERNDINAKFVWQPATERDQTLTIKWGYADETSNETYLGLSDADFKQAPNRRYRASQLDQFNSEHDQVHVLYNIAFSEQLSFSTAVYYNRFERSWNKFDGLGYGTDSNDNQLGVPVNTVLSQPEIFSHELALLRGERDSGNTTADIIDVTNNDRSYGSEGAQFGAIYRFDTGAVSHELKAGARFHHDYVDRLHSPADYLMRNGLLVLASTQNRAPKAFNHDETDAIAVYVSDTISFGDWRITAGVRSESIDATHDDKSQANGDNSRSTSTVKPGLGVTWQATDSWQLLAGVYQGFSPAGPQSSGDIEDEEALNIEYGARYSSNNFSADVIGFFSDYDNFIGRCRASDVGCTVGEEFNGGSVEVAGTEVLLTYTATFGQISMPISFNYTYTDSAFQERFDSSFSQWGLVQAGDELPYVPEQVARFNIALQAVKWALNAGVSHTSETRDVPGQGAIAAEEKIDARTIVDLAASYNLSQRLQVGVAVDNVFDEQNVVSRRPFGARPDKPRAINGSISYSF